MDPTIQNGHQGFPLSSLRLNSLGQLQPFFRGGSQEPAPLSSSDQPGPSRQAPTRPAGKPAQPRPPLPSSSEPGAPPPQVPVAATPLGVGKNPQREWNSAPGPSRVDIASVVANTTTHPSSIPGPSSSCRCSTFATVSRPPTPPRENSTPDLAFSAPIGHLSAAVQETLQAALAPSTLHNYELHVRAFGRFIAERNIEPTNVTSAIILEFLARFSTSTYSYSYVRSLKSAVIQAIQIRNPTFLPDIKLFERFMRGARRRCRAPRVNRVIWDAQKALDFLKQQPLPSTILHCAQEAVFLLALATGARADDLWKLGAAIWQEGRSWFFPFLEPQKTTFSAGRGRDGILLSSFRGEPRLCPIAAVQRYVSSTSSFADRSNFLFVSATTGERIKKTTLRFWLAHMLNRAGISAPPGSIRSAATSYAWWRRRSFDAIASMTGWTSESTFQRFYRRRISSKGRNLLNSSDSTTDDDDLPRDEN